MSTPRDLVSDFVWTSSDLVPGALRVTSSHVPPPLRGDEVASTSSNHLVWAPPGQPLEPATPHPPMKETPMKTKTTLAAIAALLLLAGCTSAADRTSENLSKAAENFEIDRRIVFVNGITDEYLLVVEGKCSIEDRSGEGKSSLEVTCKVGDDAYEKHFLGLSDNVTYVAEQMETADVDEYRTRVIFRPESIVPDPEIAVEGDQ